MGSNPSIPLATDYQYNRNFSVKYGISEWTNFAPKNADYYNGKRFFRISRSLYPQFDRGLLWGYTYKHSWKKFDKEYVCLDCGKATNLWCENTGACSLCCNIKSV